MDSARKTKSLMADDEIVNESGNSVEHQIGEGGMTKTFVLPVI
jgi:hypothetical protein